MNKGMKDTKQKTHVTPSMVNDLIRSEEYKRMGNRTTICLMTLKNGMEMVGVASRQETTFNNNEIAHESAREDAFSKAYEVAVCFYNAVDTCSTQE